MRLMFNILKSEKKKGFTLLELVTVLAVISILSAALIPKVGNYINEAKKVAVLNEAKTVVTAYEGARYRINSTDSITIKDLINQGILDSDSIKKINSSFSVAKCKNLMDTENYAFNMDSGTASEPQKISNTSTE